MNASADRDARYAVGIVVPAFNAGKFLRRTLDSIRCQEFEDWRAVIVDDGSSDDTLSLAREFAASDMRFSVLDQLNRGVCIARNRGTLALPGRPRYVAYMDADDVWLPHALSVLATAADSHPTFAGVHGLGEFVDEAGGPIMRGVFSDLGRSRKEPGRGRPRVDTVSPHTGFRHLATASSLFPPGLYLIRQEVLCRVGLFDPRVRLSEDWDLLLRVTRHAPLVFVDDVILHYRRHDSNVSTGREVRDATALVRRRCSWEPSADRRRRRDAVQSYRALQLTNAHAHRQRLSKARGARDPRRIARAVFSLSVALTRFGIGRPLPPTKELGSQ